MISRNGAKPIEYCKDCPIWRKKAREYRIEKTNAADLRDVGIPCPLGYSGDKELQLFSRPLKSECQKQGNQSYI